MKFVVVIMSARGWEKCSGLFNTHDEANQLVKLMQRDAGRPLMLGIMAIKPEETHAPASA